MILLDLLLLSRSFWTLFGSRGYINEELLAASNAPLAIWPLLKMFPMLQGEAVLTSLMVTNVILACASIRFGPMRGWGALQYALYVCFVQSINLGTYGMHEFLTIALFYLMIAGFFFSRSPEPAPPLILGTAFRVHLAIGYCAAGASKALGVEWWTGESVWRATHRDDMSRWAMVNLNQVSLPHWVFFGGALFTIFGELLYPLSLYRRLAPYFIGMMILMHLGTIVFQGLYLFGATMIGLNLFALSLSRIAEPAGNTSEVAAPQIQ